MPWDEGASQLGSGLVDRMQFTINTARFKFPFEKRPQDCALVLDGERNVDGDVQDDHIWLKVGAFEPGDAEGTFIVHETDPTNPAKKINKRSNYGKWLQSAFEVGVPLEKLQPEDRHQYAIRDALMWEGMVLDIEYVEETFQVKDDETGQPKTITSRQPVIRQYLGQSDGSGTPSSAPPVETGAQPTSPAAAASNGGGAMDEAKATELAKASGAYLQYAEAFVKAGGDENSPMFGKAFYENARS